jgi:uncharacterized damage-inducible protein DinB
MIFRGFEMAANCNHPKTLNSVDRFTAGLRRRPSGLSERRDFDCKSRREQVDSEWNEGRTKGITKRDEAFLTEKEQAMASEKALREQLVEMLNWGDAHADFNTTVKDLPAEARGKRPKGGAHSPWELMEHMRIAQRDILDFIRDAKHKSPEFPAGYWPSGPAPANDQAWEKSAAAFRADLRALTDLVARESTDLLKPIPHGDGKTVLREVLLVADHTAYHLGQLVLTRRLLDAWHPEA